TRLTARRAANGVRKALLRKASEADAHVVSFGTRVGGLRPSDSSQWVYRQAEREAIFSPLFAYCFS
ncbi:MAG: hypothetical protein IKU70_06680, partial [Clostridia bacterium]|nr:hypothetical protein [Clostridia bacterium]